MTPSQYRQCVHAGSLALLLIASPAWSQARASSQTAAAQVTGPIAATATSHAFLSSAAGTRELEAAGYVEEEYFLSGQANVYDWSGTGRGVKVVAGPSRYTTRILVRRPRDAAKFSGNVEVGILNASMGVDFGGPIDPKRMMAQGDVWVGITTKSLTAETLKRFDPVRYAALNWLSPVPAAQRCAYPSIIPVSTLGGQDVLETMVKTGQSAVTPELEDGLVWDMIGQLGLLLKSDERTRILPRFAKPTTILDGVSQSAIIIRTYAAVFHDRYRTPDGKPVYDGYLPVVGANSMRLNQCTPDVPYDDPRQEIIAADAKYIDLYSEGEMWAGKYTRRPDRFTAKGGLVTYEVTGGSHGAGETPGIARPPMFPDQADLAKSGFKPPAMGSIASMYPAGAKPNDLAWQPLVRGAYRNLQIWTRGGARPPRAPQLQLNAQREIVRDADGNALGGLRMPYVDAPTNTYQGSMGSSGYAAVAGYRKPLPAARLATLYPTDAAYSAKYAASTERLRKERFITDEDAAAIMAAMDKTKPAR